MSAPRTETNLANLECNGLGGKKGSPEEQLKCVRSHLMRFLAPGDLEKWIEIKAPIKFEPFYASIDIRDAGFKIAPVDANLYPAGFNNICPEDIENAGAIVGPILQRHLGQMPKRIAILPEFHTKNLFYAENLHALRKIFRGLGIETEIGWLHFDENGNVTNSTEPVTLSTPDGRTMTAYPFQRKDDKLFLTIDGQEIQPDFILLNNDFSSGYPKILSGLKQRVEPSAKLGWHTRKKSDFFTHYNALAKELAEKVQIDPWHLSVATELVDNVDFNTGKGMDRIAAAVDRIIAELKEQYVNRGIDEKPFVFVKNNAGTYGMGILRVESGEELLKLNRRERNKMAVGKNALEVHDVVVQEGIPTRFELDGVFSEPAIYLMGRQLLGGFLRQNPNRGKIDNLNSKGMVFRKLCISDLRIGADRDLSLELVYGTIAQLSAAAITLEIAHVEETIV